MKRYNRISRDRRRGASLIEFAVTMPLLLVIAVGAADFSRLFVESTILSGAAASGAKYGAQDNSASAEFARMETLAGRSASQANGTTTTAERLCDCPDSPGVWVDCLASMCPNDYGTPRAYVRVNISKTFTTLGSYPKVPDAVPLSLSGYMRVQ